TVTAAAEIREADGVAGCLAYGAEVEEAAWIAVDGMPETHGAGDERHQPEGGEGQGREQHRGVRDDVVKGAFALVRAEEAPTAGAQEDGHENGGADQEAAKGHAQGIAEEKPGEEL